MVPKALQGETTGEQREGSTSSPKLNSDHSNRLPLQCKCFEDTTAQADCKGIIEDIKKQGLKRALATSRTPKTCWKLCQTSSESASLLMSGGARGNASLEVACNSSSQWQTAAYNAGDGRPHQSDHAKSVFSSSLAHSSARQGLHWQNGHLQEINSLILALSQAQHRPRVRHFSPHSLFVWETMVGNKRISHTKHFGALYSLLTVYKVV